MCLSNYQELVFGLVVCAKQSLPICYHNVFRKYLGPCILVFNCQVFWNIQIEKFSDPLLGIITYFDKTCQLYVANMVDDGVDECYLQFVYHSLGSVSTLTKWIIIIIFQKMNSFLKFEIIYIFHHLL